MKRILLTGMFVCALSLAIFWLWERHEQMLRLASVPASGGHVIASQRSEAGEMLRPPVSVSNVLVLTRLEDSIKEPRSTLNFITATNIAQWTNTIKGLKQYGRFEDKRFGSESWNMEWPERVGGVSIRLQNGTQSVGYVVNFIDIETFLNDGNIRRVEMQSPIMNINETRELGLQLCELLGVGSKDFLAWCDKVGNHWLDAPSFNTGNYQCGFGIHMTYDDDKPWYINFVIVNRGR